MKILLSAMAVLLTSVAILSADEARDRNVSRLMAAASTGDLDAVKEAVAADPELVNSRDDFKNTPLHYAALNGHPETCKLLVSLGADVNSPGQLGASPLHCAARGGHKLTARALIEAGADINAICDLGNTPLHLAAERGHDGLVTFLLLRRADPDKIADMPDARSALSLAVENGHRPCVDVLLEAGASPDVGLSSLAIAARVRQSDIALALLETGADPVAPERYGWTALHWAAGNGDAKLLTVLLDRGANVDVLDKAGNAPLHWAASAGQAGTAGLLLEREADAEAANVDGHTPLHLAAETVSVDTVRLLLEKGADPNALDTWSSTPLHRLFSNLDTMPGSVAPKRATIYSPPMLENPQVTPQARKSALEALLAAGADPSARDRGGKTPADIARSRGIECEMPVQDSSAPK